MHNLFHACSPLKQQREDDVVTVMDALSLTVRSVIIVWIRQNLEEGVY